MPLTPLDIATYEESAVGMATRAMAENEGVFINFVDFTTDLLSNVVQTLTQSTLDQLEAYADLVQAISGSVDAYEQRMYPDLTSDSGEAMRYINDAIGGTYALNPWTPITKTGATFSSSTVTIAEDKVSDFIAHFAGVTANVTVNGVTGKHAMGDTGVLTPSNTNQNISITNLYEFVLAKFRREIGSGYDRLVTILQMGMQQLVVEGGSVETAVSVRVTGQDTNAAQLKEQSSLDKTISGSLGGKVAGKILKKVASGNLGGKLSGKRSSTSISVRTEQKSASTTVEATMSGRVHFKFATKTLPSVGP